MWRGIPPVASVPSGFEFFSRDVDEVYARMVENGAFLPLAPPVDYYTTSIGQGWAQLRGPWAGGNLGHAHDHALCASPSAAVERRPAGQACRQHAIATEQQAPAVTLYHCILDIPIRFDGMLCDPAVNSVIGLSPDHSCLLDRRRAACRASRPPPGN